MKYLVNRKTKEHVIKHKGFASFDVKRWHEVKADSEGWIKHEGNACPLPDDVKCEVTTLSGSGIIVKAGRMDWGSVVRYRPILEAEKVQEPDYDPRSVSFNLLDRLKAAHAHAQTIPDLEAELREVLGSMGYDLVARSPFTQQRHGAEGE